MSCRDQFPETRRFFRSARGEQHGGRVHGLSADLHQTGFHHVQETRAAWRIHEEESTRGEETVECRAFEVTQIIQVRQEFFRLAVEKVSAVGLISAQERFHVAHSCFEQ